MSDVNTVHAPNDSLCAEVVQKLNSLGYVAYHEYPDCVSIHTRNGLNVWTGLTGWHGSWMKDGEPIEGGDLETFLQDCEISVGCDKLTDDYPVSVIAVRWALAITAVERESVIKVTGVLDNAI